MRLQKYIIISCIIILILSLIGIGIVSGTIFLFHEIDEFKQELKFQKECLSKRLKGDFTTIFHNEIKRKKIYKVINLRCCIKGIDARIACCSCKSKGTVIS